MSEEPLKVLEIKVKNKNNTILILTPLTFFSVGTGDQKVH